MKTWWNDLQARERLILGAGGVAAAIIILWAAIWNPLSVATAELDGDVASKQRLLGELTRLENTTAAAPQGARPAAGGSLFVVVDQTIRSQGLASTLKRNQQNGADSVNLTFQAASFDALILWLAQLDREHGIAVQSASFSEARQPGLVNSTLVLRRG